MKHLLGASNFSIHLLGEPTIFSLEFQQSREHLIPSYCMSVGVLCLRSAWLLPRPATVGAAVDGFIIRCSCVLIVAFIHPTSILSTRNIYHLNAVSLPFWLIYQGRSFFTIEKVNASRTLQPLGQPTCFLYHSLSDRWKNNQPKSENNTIRNRLIKAAKNALG